MIALDIETYDPNMKTLGPGSQRHDGEILCCCSYNGKEADVYIPGTASWSKLKDILLDEKEAKCFHNGVYDLDWLCTGYDLHIKGKIHDTMTRAAFIDEFNDLDLDACCKRHKVPGKNKTETIEYWFEQNKKALGLKGTMWANAKTIWNDEVGRALMIKYCQQDCKATYELFYAQEPWMAGMEDAYDLDCRLYPLLIEMKRNGVRVDEAKLNALTSKVQEELHGVEHKLLHEWGVTPTIIASPKQMGIKMHELKIVSPMKTAKGAESWSSDVLDRLQEHEVIREIQHQKVLSALLNKYLQGNMANAIVNGRIYCTFTPNKRDDGGTVTGRLSCKTPNLQNISAREQKHGWNSYGPEMRDLFIPEEDCWMFACDYSQIEYLLLAHYAVGPQADWFRGQANAGVDFHTTVQNSMNFPERSVVKRLNYGKMYGMGIGKMMQLDYMLFSKLAKEKNMDVYEYCCWVNDLYNERMPVIKDTMGYIQNLAKMQGFVTSISGRKHHKPKPYFDPAVGKWNDGLYKMTNYLIQGSASDILKKGLVDSWESGVFDVLKMHLTVHDENVCSVPKSKEGVEAAVHMEACMNNAYKDILTVPMKAVGGIGDSWDSKHAEDDWQNLREQYGFARSGEHN